MLDRVCVFGQKAQVFQRLIGNKDKTWSRLSNFGLKVELPSNTLIEVEIVQYKDAVSITADVTHTYICICVWVFICALRCLCVRILLYGF